MLNPFSLIEALFRPGVYHAEEERWRLAFDRVDAGNSDPGAGPVDLDSGRVVIAVGPLPGAPEPERPGPAEAAGTADGPARGRDAAGPGPV